MKQTFAPIFIAAGLQLLATMAQSTEVLKTQNLISKETEAIPLDQLGAKARAGYHGDGLAVDVTEVGARLRCVFQRMEGEATRDGLWLTSTGTDQPADRFQVIAVELTRQPAAGNASPVALGRLDSGIRLPQSGAVVVEDQIVRFTRPGLVEEYSVSMDGIRQDFVVRQRVLGEGQLKVRLAVSGARVESATDGAQLVLEKSGRRIAYCRLHATDANGNELSARIVAEQESGMSLALVVNDSGAVYPVRIDPTFSDANWISMGGFPGLNGSASAAVADDSGNLYVGGYFTIAGAVVASNIAKWDGTNWSALGSGMNNEVRALAVSGRDLYAGGAFTTAGGIEAYNVAKWDGSRWSALGSGMNNEVRALAVSGSNLYVGGSFTIAGSTAANRIAKWDGNSWSALGSGLDGSPADVYALAILGNDLYAGGCFTSAGSSPASFIAKWDGGNWSGLGSGLRGDALSGYVSALIVSGSDLYAGGHFWSAGGTPATNIAKWDGSNWSGLGSGLSGSGFSTLGLIGSVYALALSGRDLYAAGEFDKSGGIVANRIAKWNGSGWSALGSGIRNSVNAIVVLGNEVYAVGPFMTKWDGSRWSALCSGIDGSVSVLAASGGGLYAGGRFTTVGWSTATNIAKWDGREWSALGSGIWGPCFSLSALTASGDDLYAAGYFTMAGGSPINNLAKWDGSKWSALGSGLSGSGFGADVRALAILGSDLYAGGRFWTASGSPATNIAKWDGTNWSALGFGIEGLVSAMAMSGSNLYVGGGFMAAGGDPATNIAKWDGTNWSALGFGIGGPVSAMAMSGSDLYVGGSFTTAGRSAAANIARWDGREWSALGSGINGSVCALVTSGRDLYAAGNFLTAGGNLATNIAKWDGTNWSALGSGIGGQVSAMAIFQGDLYVAGYFTTAGGKVSTYLARAHLDSPTLSIVRSNGHLTLSWPTSFARAALQQNPDPGNSSTWAPANYPLTTNGTVKSATIPIAPANHFFRLFGN